MPRLVPAESGTQRDLPPDWVPVPLFLEGEDLAVLICEHESIVALTTDIDMLDSGFLRGNR